VYRINSAERKGRVDRKASGLMIEIKKDESSGKYGLVIDGVITSEEEIKLTEHTEIKRPIFSAVIRDTRVNQKIIAYRFSNLPESLFALVLKLDKKFTEAIAINQSIIIRRMPYTGVHKLYFDFEFDLQKWKQLWSVKEYLNESHCTFTQKGYADLVWNDSPSGDGFSVVVSEVNKEVTIESELSKHIEAVRELIEITEISLESSLRKDSVVVYFDFPDGVRVPCEQYLLYFIQFLNDLGVEATAELQHEAGQVLFAVTPTNKQEALGKIRAALETYLQLPSNPNIDSLNLEQEVAIQRLAANIDHLRGQLRLSHALLQAKDATIQAQDITIRQQQHLLSGEIIIESMKNVTSKPKEQDKEELLGGIIEITKYEGKGVNVNLAEIFRRFRRLFSEEKE
jgi:hypothetical protein